MIKWKASMPREKAREGGANVVLAYRASNGKRVELEATMSAADADMLMRSAITFMANFKENATPTAAHAATKDKPLTRCAAARDGDCTHAQCPQLRDGEPAKTGRHCPLDTYTDED